MRDIALNPSLFVQNRSRLAALLPPRSMVIVQANDVFPSNADGHLPYQPNSDLFYLTGVNQEESILILFPDADDPHQRELLFLRETNETISIWEGHKLTVVEAQQRTGIEHLHWLKDFPNLLHRLMCEAEHVFLAANEHKRAVITVEARDARFIRQLQHDYPLHQYHRLARPLHSLRLVKSEVEIAALEEACELTSRAFRRVVRATQPGVNEREIEAEFAHEFIRGRGAFAYQPIIASGANSCVLHYTANDRACRKGEVLLLDVAASYANYNADLTRTIPVSGRFTRRQKQVYRAVQRVLEASTLGLVPGKRWKEWQRESEQMMEKELIDLGLVSLRAVRQQDPKKPLLKKYFMHGLGHPLGLDVHDVGDTTGPFDENWVMTVEPGIYIREEGFGIRLENDIVIRRDGNRNLLQSAPIEPEEIEEMMNRGRR